MIGVLTAVVGDCASLFGCTVGLKDSITAISFVALGTSVPGIIFLLSVYHIYKNLLKFRFIQKKKIINK